MTIDRARYLHKVATARMEEALLRWEKGEREPAVVPVSIADLLAAAAPVCVIPDDMYHRISDSLARRPDAGAVPRNVGRWAQLAAGLPSNAGLVVVGGVLGWLLRGPTKDVSPAAPLSAPSSIAVVASVAPEATSPTNVETTASGRKGDQQIAPPHAPPERRSQGALEDEQLLDQAQAALNAGDVHAALAVLSKRNGHFAGGPSASVRQRLLVRACALPGGRAEPECADGGGP